LPSRIGSAAPHWSLELGEPFRYAFTSIAIPARRPDGSDVVLKVRHVDRETELEPLALREWNGDGAVLLLDELPEQEAILLERCLPGTPLSDEGPDYALKVMAALLPRLWKPATTPPFRSLAEEAAHWESGLVARGRDRLVDAALDALRTLPGTQGEQVLVNQDLHGWNVLAAQREAWLAIDPKPLVGEREFGLAPIIRSTELGLGKRETIWRLDRLTSELGLDRERARLWCIAQTVAWSSDELPTHADVARWLLEA
jgi:streptomycin 6-kinase